MRPFVLAGQIVELSARGLKIIRAAPYWVPSEQALARGYTPRTLKLHFALTFASGPDAIVVRGERHELDRLAAHCEKQWLDMLEWLGDPEIQSLPVYDGTWESLIRCYQTDPESPYADRPQSTQRCYDDWCRTLSRAIGKKRVDHTNGRSFRTWFREIMAPAEPGGTPRVRLATGCVKQMVPILLSYGVEIGVPNCLALLAVHRDINLRAPAATIKEWNARKPQRIIMDFAHAEAIVNEGIRKNTFRSLSVAIGVAAQFEFTLAQIDVIGWWEKLRTGKARDLSADSIVLDSELWHGGLRYEDFLPDMELDMRRSKNGRGGVFAVEEYPLFMRALAAIPIERRSGPVAIDDHGFPFFGRRAYNRAYHEIAGEAGVPAQVWNMLARHGGGSEADDAGAQLSDISTHLQHGNVATTKKHYIKPTTAPTRRVARARVAHRATKESA